MKESPIVLFSSEEAASNLTVTGWVSRRGLFYGANEHVARWDGCTHIVCDCGEITEKTYTHCKVCREKRQAERFAAKERVLWDGVVPLCLWDGDRYFFSEEDLLDYCDEHDVAPGDLSLVICEPTFARQINPTEFYCDDLPDDGDGEVPAELAAAFAELNERIAAYRVPLSWSPGKYAAILPDHTAEDLANCSHSTTNVRPEDLVCDPAVTPVVIECAHAEVGCYNSDTEITCKSCGAHIGWW